MCGYKFYRRGRRAGLQSITNQKEEGRDAQGVETVQVGAAVGYARLRTKRFVLQFVDVIPGPFLVLLANLPCVGNLHGADSECSRGAGPGRKTRPTRAQA